MYVIVEVAGQQFKAEKGSEALCSPSFGRGRLVGELRQNPASQTTTVRSKVGCTCSRRRLGEVQDSETLEG